MAIMSRCQAQVPTDSSMLVDLSPSGYVINYDCHIFNSYMQVDLNIMVELVEINALYLCLSSFTHSSFIFTTSLL